MRWRKPSHWTNEQDTTELYQSFSIKSDALWNLQTDCLQKRDNDWKCITECGRLKSFLVTFTEAEPTDLHLKCFKWKYLLPIFDKNRKTLYAISCTKQLLGWSLMENVALCWRGTLQHISFITASTKIKWFYQILERIFSKKASVDLVDIKLFSSTCSWLFLGHAPENSYHFFLFKQTTEHKWRQMAWTIPLH